MWIVNPLEFGSRKCCILNCTLVHSGAMIKDGPYVPEVMIREMKINASAHAKVWNPIIENVVNKCFEDGKKLIQKFQGLERSNPPSQMNPVSIFQGLENFYLILTLKSFLRFFFHFK